MSKFVFDPEKLIEYLVNNPDEWKQYAGRNRYDLELKMYANKFRKHGLFAKSTIPLDIASSLLKYFKLALERIASKS